MLLRLRTTALSAIEAKNCFTRCYSGYGQLLLVLVRLRRSALSARNVKNLLLVLVRLRTGALRASKDKDCS